MAKAPDAFRTISEVSDALDTPAHVLRFWESKFKQIKPVKRAGGRRYYRPDDISLLAGIKSLLHEQGMTIKGAQKLLREKGVKHVAGLVDGTTANDAVDTPVEMPVKATTKVDAPAVETPVAKPTPATRFSIVPDTPAIDLDALTPPANDKEIPARFFDKAADIDGSYVQANASKIAPLVARLETVRNRMRAG